MSKTSISHAIRVCGAAGGGSHVVDRGPRADRELPEPPDPRHRRERARRRARRPRAAAQPDADRGAGPAARHRQPRRRNGQRRGRADGEVRRPTATRSWSARSATSRSIRTSTRAWATTRRRISRPVVYAVSGCNVLVVHSSLPVKTFKEFVALARVEAGRAHVRLERQRQRGPSRGGAARPAWRRSRWCTCPTKAVRRRWPRCSATRRRSSSPRRRPRYRR